MPSLRFLFVDKLLREFLISHLPSDRGHDRVSVGTEKCGQRGLLLGGTGINAVSRLIGVENDEVLAGEVDVQTDDIRDLFMNGELEYPPGTLRSA